MYMETLIDYGSFPAYKFPRILKLNFDYLRLLSSLLRQRNGESWAKGMTAITHVYVIRGGYLMRLGLVRRERNRITLKRFEVAIS